MISKGLPLSEIEKSIELVRNNYSEVNEYIAKELRFDIESLRSAVDKLNAIDSKHIEEYREIISNFSALITS